MGRRKKASRSESPKPKDRLAGVLKWIGAATAVLTLVFGLHRLTDMVTTARETRREVAAMVATAELQGAAGNHEAAWQTLERATTLDPKARHVRAALEDAGMQWLAAARVRVGERTFSDIVDAVSPELTRSAALASGQRQADLLAHVGWGEFLRGRAGGGSGDPESHYRQALTIDPSNVYAHTMLGHWIAWRGGDLAEAARHFASALTDGRDRPWVRAMHFAALRNRPGEAADVLTMELGLELIGGGEAVEDDWSRELLRATERHLGPHCRRTSPPDDLATAGTGPGLPDQARLLEWLRDAGLADHERVSAEFFRACLLEADRQPEAALRAYRDLAGSLPPQSRYAPFVEAALVRLAPAP